MFCILNLFQFAHNAISESHARDPATDIPEHEKPPERSDRGSGPKTVVPLIWHGSNFRESRFLLSNSSSDLLHSGFTGGRQKFRSKDLRRSSDFHHFEFQSDGLSLAGRFI